MRQERGEKLRCWTHSGAKIESMATDNAGRGALGFEGAFSIRGRVKLLIRSLPSAQLHVHNPNKIMGTADSFDVGALWGVHVFLWET